jgi:very-short-patch-repair endonuclease
MYRDVEQREFARQLRNRMTAVERTLWRLLRADQLRGFRFRRQAAIGSYVVDFVCFSRKLIVELDGPQHAQESAQSHDAVRGKWLASQGFRTLRFWNHELDQNPQLVAEAILMALEERSSIETHPLSPALSTRERGPEDINGAGCADDSF